MNGFEALKRDFTGKKVLIFGLGLLGRGLGDTILFCSIGSQVRVTDIKSAGELGTSLNKLKGLDIEYTLGEHIEADIEWADVIVRNASVPWQHPLLEKARSLNKRIVMDSQLFMEYLPEAVTVIGVTGTRGKTTTCMMIAQVLKEATEYQVLLGGNVRGIATLPQLKTIQDPSKTYVVLELSSWQLQAFGAAKNSPQLAVVTNIYPDHLNSYDSMASYIEDKKQIFLHQKSSDFVWLNRDQASDYQDWFDKIPSQLNWFDKRSIPSTFKWQLKGEHNLENAAACVEVCTQLEVSAKAVLEVLEHFSPVENRLALVRRVNQAEVYNDSNSTTPIATIKALESFDTKVSLIVGGEDKKLPVTELIDSINTKADRVYLLEGSGTSRIQNRIAPSKVAMVSSNFEKLVNQALADVAPGEILIFSPGFTSFNLFENEYDRGDRFCKLVSAFDEKNTAQESKNSIAQST